MAKRRNAKKEKAARNKINARKFRKQTSRYGNRGRKNYNGSSSENKETTESNNSGNTSESATANNN
ncbi:MAG: hypothetical protein WBM44_24475 [Waterburya sp.]